MIKRNKKQGVSLSETAIVIAILGCLVVLAVGMFNYANLKNNTIAARQAKIESALKTATMSIVSNDKLTAAQACNPEFMRDKYVEKLNGATVTDDIEVNGKSVPAFTVSDYGILAVDATDDCQANWDNAVKPGIVGGGALGSASEPSRGSGTSSAAQGGAISNTDGELATIDAVVIYSFIDGDTANASVPVNVSASNAAPSGTLTSGTMAFAVNAKGMSSVYSSGSVKASASLGNSNNSSSFDNHDISYCKGNYSYKSTCPNVKEVAYYETIINCRKDFCPGNGYDINGNLVLTGQVNFICALGSGNAGECSCPDKTPHWTDLYKVPNSRITGICLGECSELGLKEAPDGTCYCPSDHKWDPEIQKCVKPGSCDKDYLQWDEATSSCICKTEAALLEMNPHYFDICEMYDKDRPEAACKKMKPNWNKDTGTCECPKPFVIRDGECICESPRTLNNGVCECDKTKVQLSGEEIFDPSKETCKFDCASINLLANESRTECITPECGCLKKYDTTKGVCVCDPAQQYNDRCINSDEKFDPNSDTCKACKSPNRTYNNRQSCVCKPKSELQLAANEIYDPNKENCIYVCKDGAVANADHTECIGSCLEVYNYTSETLDCVDPSETTKIEECLHNTNYIYSSTDVECKKPCTGLTAPDSRHMNCPCDESKVATELNKSGNLNKIYDLNNAPTCMKPCTGQTYPNTDRKSCKPVDCLYETTDNITQHCIPYPSDTVTIACLKNTNYISTPSATGCKTECNDTHTPNSTYKACICKSAKDLQLADNEIYDPTGASCVYVCKDGAVANADHTECIGACLQTYNYTKEILECVPPTATTTIYECLKNTKFIYDPSGRICESECEENHKPDESHTSCICKSASELNLGNDEIYDPTQNTCVYKCKDGAVANQDHTECIGSCLEVYNYTTETLDCVDPSETTKIVECLHNTNYVYSSADVECKKPCAGLTSPDSVHKTCPCDYDKVTRALKEQGNLNKIYDLENAPTCMMPCQGQTFPERDRLSCRPVDCLYETTDNVTQHCKANPTDAETIACLQGTNFVSNPTATTTSCKVECTGLTSPNNVYKMCNCNQQKVAAALTQTGNLNKIYDMSNAPTCMAACTGQTFPQTDRLACRPVDCLYETTDNITQHCIPHPTDAKTQTCLAGTNSISNPQAATCSEDCGTKHSPNLIHKVCECDINKMATQYSSPNMKFDATSATCESACPSSFTQRSVADPATCVCPATKPSSVTIQAGYYYDASSTVLSGANACQLACPTTEPAITNWISSHGSLLSGSKVVYDATKVNCKGTCPGNLVPSQDKKECICGLTKTSCEAGKYFVAESCSCEPCPQGYYCPGPTDPDPIKCPCGTYGPKTGLKAVSECLNCRAGYYCQEASTSPTQIQCSAGYRCPEKSCSPIECTFPITSTTPFTTCDKCRTESEIKNTNPNYFGQDEIWVNDITKQCKQCKSNMIYGEDGKCMCPPDEPYWNGEKCDKCKAWKTLYFARQSESRPNCKLYDHLMGTKGACFTDYARVPSDDMKAVAAKLSTADRNRTFNGIYAYMIALAPDGTASVVGSFTARSWYHTFPADYSSVNTARSKQAAGTCSSMCNNDALCVNTCDYLKGKVTKTTMFDHCKYVVKNSHLGTSYGDASDELCTGGSITLKDECIYMVGGILRNVTSPLILDLKGNGFKYTSVEDGVVFDLNNDGVPEKTAWTKPQKAFDDAFLVLDKNNNGQVDNGGELFGDQNGSENGFLELAKYDDNGDKLITAEDKIFNKLLVWVDFNKNAKVDYEADGTTKELKTLKDAGVTEISVNYNVEKDKNGNILKDMYGNITGFVGEFKMMVENAAGKLVETVRKMMDVFFVTQ